MMAVEDFERNQENVLLQELSLRLAKSGIDIATWGTGGAKTVGHLLKEMQLGESDVTFSPEGNVTRNVRVAWVDVLYFAKNGDVYQLYEDRQEYTDGRVRRRTLSSSLGEKFLPDEDPLQAAERALSEELGITDYVSLHAIGSEKTVHTPDTYPGLETHYDTHSFVAVISESAFNPDGYVEVQSDKSNYYSWEIIRTA
jgi:hypothetical protein